LKKGEVATRRKKYSCGKRDEPMEAPHSQYNGKQYCLNEAGVLPYQEWLQLQRTLAKEKKEKLKK